MSDRFFRALLIAALLVLLAGIGLRSPWPADEPRFAQVAREMVESGQWLFPTRGGEFYPDKPPVFMWLIALFYQLSGHLRVAFLLPSALAAIGTAWLVFDIAQRVFDKRTAQISLLMLIIAPQFLIQAKSAQIDALVCFWITLGCYGLVRHFFTGPAWRWYYLAWVAMALGIMTKGVGFLPALMLIPLAIWRKHQNVTCEHASTPDSQGAASAAAVWHARAWLGPILMLAVLALWLVPLLWIATSSANPDLIAYRDNILLRQTAQRYANSWHHIKPWHYFLTQALPTVWLPVLLVLLIHWRTFWQHCLSDWRFRILATWVALVLLFFSLSPGKREVYIFPALPMTAILAARVWSSVLITGSARWSVMALRTVALLIGSLTLTLALLAWIAPVKLGARAQDYMAAINASLAPLLALGLITLGLMWRFCAENALTRLASLVIAAWFVIALWIWPLLDPFRTPQKLMAELGRRYPENVEVGLLGLKEQFLLFSPRTLTHFGYLPAIKEQERNAWLWMREQPNRVIFTPNDLTLTCFDWTHQQLLGRAHRRDWVLLDQSTLSANCKPPNNTRKYTWTPKRKDMLQ